MNNYITIGIIVNTQGVKGDMRVISKTFNDNRFELLKYVYLENPKDNNITRYKLEKVWYHKSFVIIKLDGISDMTAAEQLKNFEVKIPISERLPLNESEYYISDLYNIKVFDLAGSEIGVLVDVLQTGSNDVYVVRNDEKGDMLLPAIKECIKEIDVENKKMTVHLLEGLEWQ